MDKLKSPRVMLDRSRVQLESLNAKFGQFAATHKYEVVREHDVKHGLDVLRMKIAGAPPLPDEFALLIGEFSNSLRASLDHLVWALVAGTPSHPKKVEFPIFNTPGQFKAERIKKIGSLPTAAQTEIEAMQPYHAGEHKRSHPLWRIYRLAVSHKHRHIIIIAHSFRYSFATGPNQRYGLTIAFRENLDADPVAPIPPLPDEFAKQIDFQVQPLFSVLLENADTDSGIFMPVPELAALYRHVRYVVFPLLERLVT